MESGEDYQIIISGWWVHIPELGLNLHEGIFCNYDGEEGGYLPDFAVTVVKEEGQTEEEWIYYEQDGFLILSFVRKLGMDTKLPLLPSSTATFVTLKKRERGAGQERNVCGNAVLQGRQQGQGCVFPDHKGVP